MSDISLSKAVRTNLLSLQNTASMMNKTQERLATGNKVNSALDNPSNFFTASSLNSRAGDLNALLDNMASGIKVIEAANNGLTALTKNLESMQSTLRQARQDKSFQTKSFEVTADSVINLAGGQFGDIGKSISLADAVQKDGVKSQLTTQATTAYVGPSTSNAGQGIGARAVVSNDDTAVDAADRLATGNKFTIAGVEVEVGADATNAGIAATAQAALDASTSPVKGKYIVTADDTGGFTVETIDPTAEAAEVKFAEANAATKASTTFNFSAVPGSITVGGQTIETGADFASFVKNLEDGAEAGKYTVESNAQTGAITLTNTEYGVDAPEVNGIPENVVGAKRVDTATITTGATANDTIELDGVEIEFTATLDAAATAAFIKNFVENNDTLSAKYDVSVAAGTLTFTAKAADAASTTPAFTDATGDIAAGAFTNSVTGVTAVNGRTDVDGEPGASVATVAAATDEFSVSYDGKTANIAITGIKGGPDAEPNEVEISKWQAATVASVNAQLEKAGVKGVEAAFDSDGKFSIVAKEAEAKTLAISGKDSVALFGANGVDTGSAEVSALNSTKTVDKFVELINRDNSSMVRASNDNGKLRIENLSTQGLDVGVDKNGNNVVTSENIGGNSVRDNLHKQFNELRDQLDKLADDASFNGINLLRGDKLTITFNENGSSSINIQSKDKSDNARSINASNLGIDSLVAIDLDSDEGIDAFLGKLSSALSDIRSQASTFGSNLSSVQNRQDFTKNMINTLETGAANLTLADMNAEAANLLALQTRQSLSSSALSMASQADQSVLQLLR